MEQTLICCADFKFYSNFDSANFARVEHVPQESPQQENVPVSKLDIFSTFEFNVWTKPDCSGTQFENGNRTWFYFGIKAAIPGIIVRLNIIDINKQAKMYSQGMAPVFKISPGKPNWERIRDKLTFTTSSDNVFSVSFKYRTPDNPDAIVYFAFTYPYSYTDLQNSLRLMDNKHILAPVLSKDDIYYVRECVCKSIEGRSIDLLTISSYHNITREREDHLQNLFPDRGMPRPFKFANKKVIFVSARVHPGETPSTFVLNGLLSLLLSRNDAVALVLRRQYVFKLIPFLNPDGVSRGHYRTDTNGTNLNRVYLQPNIHQHPSIYAARALLRYHHYGGRELPDQQLNCINNCKLKSAMEQTDLCQPANNEMQQSDNTLVARIHSNNLSVSASNAEVVVEPDVTTLIENSIITTDRQLSNMSLTEMSRHLDSPTTSSKEEQLTFYRRLQTTKEYDSRGYQKSTDANNAATPQHLISLTSNDAIQVEDTGNNDTIKDNSDKFAEVVESGLFLYVDMHGHASKKGIFMYGNHFDNMADSVECMLLPKIMSLNNHHFHFSACNFTERNMYLKDRRDGMSREGSGRVAVLKLTGLVRSYTLECNYNTGRLTNTLVPTVRENSSYSIAASVANTSTYNTIVPPKYSPHVYEEVGRALGVSILDLTGHNPMTRLPNTEFRSLSGLRQWLMGTCTTQHRLIHHHHHFHPKYTQRKQPGSDVKSTSLTAPVTPEAAATTTADVVDGATVSITGTGPLSALKEGICHVKSSTATSSRSYRYHHQHQQRHRRSQHQYQKQRYHGNSGTKAKGIMATTVTPSASTTATTHYRRQQQQQKSAPSTSPLPIMNNRRLKLREICWIKGDADVGQGKALIAKYTSITTAAATTSSDGTGAAAITAGHSKNDIEENLIVSWDSNNANPQVFAQKTNSRSVGNRSTSVAGGTTAIVAAAACGTSSNKRPMFRVHNFRRRLRHRHFTHPMITTSAAIVTSPAAIPTRQHRQHRQRQLLLRQQQRCRRQTINRGQDKLKQLKSASIANTNATTAPSTTAATASTSATMEQQQSQLLQQNQRLQRSKRKRKRNKAGLVGTVHH